MRPGPGCAGRRQTKRLPAARELCVAGKAGSNNLGKYRDQLNDAAAQPPRHGPVPAPLCLGLKFSCPTASLAQLVKQACTCRFLLFGLLAAAPAVQAQLVFAVVQLLAWTPTGP